ncbi:MAG: putative Ig domain-containing protein [Deltaproteobacteria bacterium]|nr:putative Ig domain-containing protein [Deltaproteobacteria bacterium]
MCILSQPYFRLSKKGFTLIELAIVLVIMGILVGIGVSMMGPLIKRAKLTETRETVKTVKEAVIGYTVSQKKLPASLNILGVKTQDSYGKDIFFLPSPNLTTNDLCTTNPQFLTLNDKGSPKNRVVTVILSSGENTNSDTGTNPFSILETGAATSTGSIYDDIVEYIEIDSLREKACHGINITTDNLPSGTEEVPYAQISLGATDGTLPYTWGIISGSLPPGVALSTNLISGTPTQAGTYNFTIGLMDAEARESRRSLTIVVNPNPPRIVTEFLAYGKVQEAYPSTTLGATGGKPPYSWTKTSGNLPSGLGLNATGTITGTPTQAGTYSFTIRVTDSGLPARTVDKTLSITINPAGSGGSGTGTGTGSSDGEKDSSVKLAILNQDYETSDYKINDGECKSWLPGDTISLSAGDKVNLYWQGGGAYKGQCKSFLCTKSYGDLKKEDTNSNNIIKLIYSSQCKFGDY